MQVVHPRFWHILSWSAGLRSLGVVLACSAPLLCSTNLPAGTECIDDEDCAELYPFCVGGTCVQCRNDDDCDVGQVCTTDVGACIGDCQSVSAGLALLPDVIGCEGQEIFYTSVLGPAGPYACSIWGGEWTIELPNGVVCELGGFPDSPFPEIPVLVAGDTLVATCPSAYVVDINDAGPEGALIATARWTDGTVGTFPPLTISGESAYPFKCISWLGGTGSWDNPDNWQTGEVPGQEGIEDQAVLIESAGAQVELDISATVERLTVEGGAQLAFTEGDLEIDSPPASQGILTNNGQIGIADTRSMTARAPMTIFGSQPIQLLGDSASISSASSDALITNEGIIAGHGFVDARWQNEADGVVRAGTAGGVLAIQGPFAKVNRGLFEATAGGILRIDTAVTGGGLYRADGGTLRILANVGQEDGGLSLVVANGSIEIGDQNIGVVAEGDGPVVVDPPDECTINVTGSDLIGAQSWTIGNDEPVGSGAVNLLAGALGVVHGAVWVNPNGALLLDSSALEAEDLILAEGGTLEVISSEVVLSGALDLALIQESDWDWSADSGLTVSAGGAYATLEVGGQDVGPGAGGSVGNFGLPKLTVDASVHVVLRDLTDNGNRGSDPVIPEALYVDELVLQPGAVLNLNGLHLYVDGQPVGVCPYGEGQIRNAPQEDLDGDGVVGGADLAVVLGSWGDCAHCSGDLNADGAVGAVDLAQLLGAWGLSSCLADFNRDGAVGSPDLNILLNAWGPNPQHEADLNCDEVVDAADLVVLIGIWGPCLP